MAKKSSNQTNCGRVRLFVQKIERSYSGAQGFHVLESEHFDDGLISDVTPGSCRRLLTEEVHNAGWEMWDDCIERVLKRYKLWDICEIVADAHIEYSSSFNGETTEWDADYWFQRIKHRKLNAEQIREFCREGLDEIEAEREWEEQQNREAYGVVGTTASP